MTKRCWPLFHCYHFDNELQVEDFDVAGQWCQKKPNKRSLFYYKGECCRCGKETVKII